MVVVPGDLFDYSHPGVLPVTVTGVGIDEPASAGVRNAMLDPACLVHVLGDIFPTGLQVSYVRRCLVIRATSKQIEFDADSLAMAGKLPARRWLSRPFGRDDPRGVLERGAGADCARGRRFQGVKLHSPACLPPRRISSRDLLSERAPMLLLGQG